VNSEPVGKSRKFPYITGRTISSQLEKSLENIPSYGHHFLVRTQEINN
jgi:hypothetical protein